MPTPPAICPQCGARLPTDQTCEQIFHSFLTYDYTDPGYGEVHFLTVACYMVQHEQYSRAALAWLLPRMRSFLDSALDGEQIRRQAAQEVAGQHRQWKVTRSPDEPQPPRLAWTMTIADVAAQSNDAPSYRQAVRAWARSLLAQIEA